MGILDLIRPSSARHDRGAALHVLEQDGPFTGNRGDTLWSRGYVPLSAEGAVLGEADYRTPDTRIFHCRVAGTHHRPSALRDRRFDLGGKVVLRADPSNSYDGSIVAVWDGAVTVQVGHVPAALSRSLAPLMRAGTEFAGEVIRELRLGSERGERVSLHILIAPGGALRYSVARTAEAAAG